jgi:hypothetical protein
LIENSSDAWSVSRTEAGCYLISPRRNGASRLAIGRKPAFGTGLFVVNFALALPTGNVGEPVVVQAGGHELNKTGRAIGPELMFVPLDRAELELCLRELKDTGTLWLMVKRAWIAHGGQSVLAAVGQYSEACAADTAG